MFIVLGFECEIDLSYLLSFVTIEFNDSGQIIVL